MDTWHRGIVDAWGNVGCDEAQFAEVVLAFSSEVAHASGDTSSIFGSANRRPRFAAISRGEALEMIRNSVTVSRARHSARQASRAQEGEDARRPVGGGAHEPKQCACDSSDAVSCGERMANTRFADFVLEFLVANNGAYTYLFARRFSAFRLSQNIHARTG